MGQGGAGERSVGGGSPVMVRLPKDSMSGRSEADRPFREWWAVLGTVTEAFEGFGSGTLAVDLGGNEDGGKCLFL